MAKNMTTSRNFSPENTIVAFHIGRGGRFYNAGHLSFLGEYRIDDSRFLNDLSLSEDELVYVDSVGSEVGLTVEEAKTGIGRINIDGIYDTTYTKLLSDCDDKELEAIAKTEDMSGYFAPDAVIEYAKEMLTFE